MADNTDYSQIKKGFHDYLVEQGKIKKYKNVTTKEILTEYNKEFKLFLQTQEDVNEDSFTKNVIDMKDGDTTLLDDMFDDLLNNAKKSDTVFQWADTNNDEKLSSSEKTAFKNNFFTKISKLDTSGDDAITSLDEFKKAIEGLNSDTTSKDYQDIAALFPEYVKTPKKPGAGNPPPPGDKDDDKTKTPTKEEYVKGIQDAKTQDLEAEIKNQEAILATAQKAKVTLDENVTTAKDKREAAENEYETAIGDRSQAAKKLQTADTAYTTAKQDAEAKEEAYLKAKQEMDAKAEAVKSNKEKIEEQQRLIAEEKDPTKQAELQAGLKTLTDKNSKLTGELYDASLAYTTAASERITAYSTLSTCATGLNTAATGFKEATKDLQTATGNLASATAAEAKAIEEQTLNEASIQVAQMTITSYEAELATRTTTTNDTTTVTDPTNPPAADGTNGAGNPPAGNNNGAGDTKPKTVAEKIVDVISGIATTLGRIFSGSGSEGSKTENGKTPADKPAEEPKQETPKQETPKAPAKPAEEQKPWWQRIFGL